MLVIVQVMCLFTNHEAVTIYKHVLVFVTFELPVLLEYINSNNYVELNMASYFKIALNNSATFYFQAVW